MQHTFEGKSYKWCGQHRHTGTQGTFTMIFERLHTPGPSDSHHIYRLVWVDYPEFIKHGKHRSTCDPQPRTLNQSELLSIFLNRSFHLLLHLVIGCRKYLVYSIWKTVIAILLVLSLHENNAIYFRIGVFADQIHHLTSVTHVHFPYIVHAKSYCQDMGKDRVFSCQDIARNKFSVWFSMFDAGFGAFDQNHHYWIPT
jgi:hypothetical protein